MEATAEESRKHRLARAMVRMLSLAVAAVLALGVLPWPWAPMILPAASPYVGICSAVAARSVGVATLVSLPTLLVVLVRRRWFCRYACPVGLLADQVGRLGPWAGARCEKLPPLGQWVALLTLGGALVGYPLLLWTDPLAMFSGSFSLWRHAPGAAGLLPATGLAAVLVISLALPNSWCARLCPLGATQDLLAIPRRAFRRQESPPHPGREGRLARRSVLAMGAGATWAALALKGPRGSALRPLRPPGAADEQQLTGLCIRCGTCVRECPAKIIHPDPGQGGIAGLLTPVIRFDGDYCHENCHKCTQGCPSGAIARLSLEEKNRAAIGLAKLDMSLCLLAQNRECSLCIRNCPYDAIRTVFSESDYVTSPRVDPRRCNGCGACEVACPTSPVKAIAVHPC